MLSSVFLFFSFSGSEIMLILFVALILFGGDKFPEIARGLGKGIREFKDMSDGVKREIHSQINNYDAEPKRTDTTPAAPTTEIAQSEEKVYDHTSDFHQNHDISVTGHESHLPAPAESAPQDRSLTSHEEHPVAPAAPTAPFHEPLTDTPKEMDPNRPPNTMPHQSY
jgi:sec-independent protein translocase protein TatA